MQSRSFSIVLNLSTALLVAITGCSAEQTPSGGGTPAATADVHDHPTTGPHGGQLIELGKEEYHVEMLHDDAGGTVTFHILDGTAKKATPIDAVELVVNLKHDGKPEQFKVAAQRDPADPDGKSSRFVSTDLDAKGTEPELVVTIGGNQFRGSLAHDHDGDKK